MDSQFKMVALQDLELTSCHRQWGTAAGLPLIRKSGVVPAATVAILGFG